MKMWLYEYPYRVGVYTRAFVEVAMVGQNVVSTGLGPLEG